MKNLKETFLFWSFNHDGLVKSQHHPSTGSGWTVVSECPERSRRTGSRLRVNGCFRMSWAKSKDRLTAQGESREARDNLLIFRSCWACRSMNDILTLSVKLNTCQDTERIHLSVKDSSTYLIKGEMKNSITLLSPVLISAVTAIPGAREMSLSSRGWKINHY